MFAGFPNQSPLLINWFVSEGNVSIKDLRWRGVYNCEYDRLGEHNPE